MKNIIFILVLFSISVICLAQKIEWKRVDTLRYSFSVSDIKNPVKYHWSFASPPKYNEQFISTKHDTITINFMGAGTVTMNVKVQDKNGDWSKNIFENIKIK